MKQNVLKMGVINITPDSFSEADPTIEKEKLTEKFEAAMQWANIIDIGAESTAPFNSPISEKEEVERFEKYFLDHLHELPTYEGYLSIDTYRPRTFIYVSNRVRAIWPKVKMIFNDVSGKIDDELIKLKQTIDFDFIYVFSHNLAPTRNQTQDHMSYVYSGNDLIAHLNDYFRRGEKILKDNNIDYWLDPCFGFSKNREQNQLLLKNFSAWANAQETRIVMGISRKSFIRIPVSRNPKESYDQKILDGLQGAICYQVFQACRQDLALRVHDPSAFDIVEGLYELNK